MKSRILTTGELIKEFITKYGGVRVERAGILQTKDGECHVYRVSRPGPFVEREKCGYYYESYDSLIELISTIRAEVKNDH